MTHPRTAGHAGAAYHRARPGFSPARERYAIYPSGQAPAARTLLDILTATHAAHPHAPAIDDGRVVLDYAALAAEVRRRGTQLRRAGIGPGDRVGVRVPSGTADLYIAILAVLGAGAAYVPVDVDDPEERAEMVWSEAGVCAIISVDPRAPERISLVHRPENPPVGGRRRVTPDCDAWVIFTSGSTGKPKGVAVTHRSAAAFVDAEARLFLRRAPLGPGDRVLAGLSVAFDASCEEMWLAWRHGACLVPAPRSLVRAGADLGGWLRRRRVTVVSTVPTLAALWPAEAIAGVRLVILGGEACPAELAARLTAGSAREVWNTYGPTEATVVACAAPLGEPGPVRIGLPLDGWHLAVVDDRGRPVTWGQTGELVIGGVGLARYLDPAKDAEKYAPLPTLGWQRAYRSGDLVRADPAGLVFVGRADDQVKLGGRRVELGEIDAALAALPGVAAAASAIKKTAAGTQVLAGYLVPEYAGFDTGKARALLAERLPAALLPVLIEVPELPTRTSGKVDRAALPWPPPGGHREQPESGALDETGRFVARCFSEVLGVTAGGPQADFFALGGSSLTAAQLVSALRVRYPAVSVTDLYAYPSVGELAQRLSGPAAGPPAQQRQIRRVRPVSRSAGTAFSSILAVLMVVAGLRWTISLAAANNVLDVVDVHGWAPHTPWWLIGVAWLVLLSPPGRMVIAVAGARLLLFGLRPGTYPRGGSVHLRLWTASHLAAMCGVETLAGTPWARRYARALGCRVGRDVELHTLPPTTGMAVFGDGCALEPEVDVAGWWLEGDRLHIGEVRIGAGARIGARSSVMPGAVVGERAEILPGSAVAGRVPAGARWAGSPGQVVGPAQTLDETWPAPQGRRSRRWAPAYSAALVGTGALPVLAALPGLIAISVLSRTVTGLGGFLSVALLLVPAAVVSWMLCYALLLAAAVRLTGLVLRPGMHRSDGGVAFAAWLSHRLMNAARAGLFPMYASLITPVWLRLLGARVGRRVEASTVLTIPGLTKLGDQTFLADDTLLAPYELRGGWLRLGRSEVRPRAFVGNSGIVGPGRTVPGEGLIGVLSQTPPEAPHGSSWLGQPPIRLPRKPRAGDAARTFDPPRHLMAARGAIELCRVIPLMISLLLGDLVFGVLDETQIKLGLPVTALISGLVLFTTGVLACLTASAIKWLLIGRTRPTEHPLWSNWVWRNELADVAIEELAVPWLAGAALGTPLINAWLRTLGARIGRGAYIETWWLPEPDLITIGEGATVNRGVVVQTHLFHDRIMQLDQVTLEAGATIGPHSIILPGGQIGRSATVGAASLVSRGESVPDGSAWTGNPLEVQPARAEARRWGR